MNQDGCLKIEKKREQLRRASRKYQQTHKKQKNKYMKIWRDTHLDHSHFLQKKGRIKHLYGLTLEDIKKIRCMQRNLCPICGKKLATNPTHIDHNHLTGKVRGILHPKCNMVVAYIEDYKDKLHKILKYIEE